MGAYKNKKEPNQKYALNLAKFIDLLIGTAFLTMAMFIVINIRPLSFWIVTMIALYILVGVLFIIKRKFDSRL